MYLLHRFSSFATTQSTIVVNNIASNSSTDSALSNSTNRARHTRKGRGNRHPLSVPSKKASATVSLSNTVVSAECASTGGFGTLDLLLPSPAALPETAQNVVPFPSSAPISLSCPSKYDDTHSCDFRPCSYTDAISHDTDLWPVDLRRKRAKSCLASSYVHRDAHDSRPSRADSFPSQSDGYEPDTEARFSGPSRKRRLAHSVRRVNAKKSLKGKERDGHRAGSIDEAHRTRTCSGMSNSEAYGGILADEDVEMGEPDDVTVILEQDKILVDRLSQILAEQGFRPARERLSPPHELMDAVELVPRIPPLRLPSRPLPPLFTPQSAAICEDDPFGLQPVCAGGFQASVSPPSQPMAIPFPSSRVVDDDEEMSLASDLYSALPAVMNFPSPPSAGRTQLEPLVISSPSALPPSPTTPSPTRPSHKRRHSQDHAILEMPQLVASLMMRYNDRAATRPRSKRTTDGERAERVGPSPLSKAVIVQASLES